MKEEDLKSLNYKIFRFNNTLSNFLQITFSVQEEYKIIYYLLHMNKEKIYNQKTFYVYHSYDDCHYCSGELYEECEGLSPLGEVLYAKFKQDPAIRLRLLLQ